MAASKRGNPAERNVANDRFTGYGIVQPGAGADRDAESRMNKTEKDYVTSRGKAKSAYAAVRKARRANKQPDLD